MITPADKLRGLVAEVFAAAGCSAKEAGRIAHYLVESNLAGHESHGVIRVPRYVHWLREGKIVPDQTIEVVTESDVLAVVDGRFGFGQTVGPPAVRLGMEKARRHGLSLIGLRNAGHLGRIGDWAEMAAAEGLVSIHFVNTSGLGMVVAPFGGVERRMSTNPICIGVPAADGGPPWVLDCATSIVAEGKVLNTRSGGSPLPDGALIDENGNRSTDPALIYGPLDAGAQPHDQRTGSGAIRAMGEHKGSGLAFMCELLAGALTGSGCAKPGMTQLANGMLSIYVAPDRLGGNDAQAAEIGRYIDFFKSAKPAELGGEVLCPGEPERRHRESRLADGIPLPDDTWQSLCEVARGLGLSTPRP